MGAKESRESRGWLGFCPKKWVNQAIKRAVFSFRRSVAASDSNADCGQKFSCHEEF